MENGISYGLRGRTFVVTYADSTPGREIAQRLREEGAFVVATVKGDLPPDGDGIRYRKNALHSPEECDDIVSGAGNVAGLVNCTPRYGDTSLLTMDEAGYQDIMDSVVKNAYYMSAAVARSLIARGEGGSIVNVGSGDWKFGFRDTTAFAVANGSFHTISTYIARGYADKGIRSNWVSVGRFREEVSGDPERYRAKAFPGGNTFQTGGDVAGSVLFLLSDASRAVTCANLECTAGFGFPLNL